MQHCARLLDRIIVALLLVTITQFGVELSPLTAQFFRREQGFFLKLGLAPIEMVKASSDLAGKLNVGHLILPHGDMGRSVNQDIGRLQQGIAQKAIGREITIRELVLLVFIAGYPLKPAQWRAHGEQQVEFCMLGHT